MKFSFPITLAAGLLSAGLTFGQANGTIDNGPFPDDLNGSNYTYPYPVKLFKFHSQFQDMEMAFMDVTPSCKANNQTIVMLHGKNFCGPTWIATIEKLVAHGYRVIAPDQIGFCKSTKPADYQFSLRQLVWNTRGLLDTLGIGNVTVMGHSFGGQLTAQFGLQYPETVDKLIMVDPVGLEDYSGKGVPYVSIDQTYDSEAARDYENIKAYEQAIYYVGEWQSSYDEWVYMLLDVYYGSQRENFLRCQTKIVDLVLTQTVAHYWDQMKPKTLLFVGDQDHTAIGSQWAPADVASKLGHFDVLGPQVCGEIPDCDLVEYPELGHAPMLSKPEKFHDDLFDWLSKN